MNARSSARVKGGKGRRYRKCSCPIHFDARVQGKRIQKVMETTDWEHAQELSSSWTNGESAIANPDPPAPPQNHKEMTLERAWESFLARASMHGHKVQLCPTLRFSRDEMQRILTTIDCYPDKTRKTRKANARRLRAFVLVMRYSGLRIGDVTALQPERLDGNKLFLFTQKTRVPVYVVLPGVPRLRGRYSEGHKNKLSLLKSMVPAGGIEPTA